MKPLKYKVPVNDHAWARSLAPDVDHATVRKMVMDAVAVSLDGYAGEPMSTGELVNRLWPAREGLPGYQRQRLFKTLGWLAVRDAAAYCERGALRPIGNQRVSRVGEDRRMIRPWLWRAAGEPHFEAVMPPTCPHCGGAL